ncbi:MAG: hypothetical protein AMK72_14470 [Planctomycetes bacterium SM23_25]|nr:MAG: hypothetical protein AMK72_14470 [Planctomycetes bacterium SM23_25]
MASWRPVRRYHVNRAMFPSDLGRPKNEWYISVFVRSELLMTNRNGSIVRKTKTSNAPWTGMSPRFFMWQPPSRPRPT